MTAEMSELPAAILLGAGLGTRLRPLTDALPKPVVPVLGEPLAGYSLARLARCGYSKVVVNAHHLAERLVVDLKQWSSQRLPGLDIRFSVEQPEILGTGGALVQARPLLGDSTVVVINGDILCDFDLVDLVRRHRSSGASATLLLVEHEEVEQFGAVRVDGQGRVLDLAGLASRRADAVGGPGGAQVGAGVFAGVHIVEPVVFGHLPRGASCVVRQGYAPMMGSGLDVRGIFHRGRWNDLGTTPRYLDAHHELLREGVLDRTSGRSLWGGDPPAVPGDAVAYGMDGRGVAFGDRGLVEVAPETSLEPPVAMGPGVRLGAGARVGPSCFLGAGTVVKPRTTLQRVVCWPGAVIETSAVIRDAVCFPHGRRQRLAS